MEVERDLPYIASLVSFPNRLVQFLDDLAWSVVGPQFHEAAPAVGDMRITLRVTTMTTSQVQGSRTMRHPRAITVRHQKVTGTMDLRLITVEIAVATPPPRSMVVTPRTMRMPRDGSRMHYPLRWLARRHLSCKHVIEEFTRLRDFISTLVPPSGGISTSVAAPLVNEPNIWDDPHEGSDIRSPHDDDCADEAEMQEGNAGEGSDKRSPHDDDHADEGEMHEVNDGEGRDERSPQDDDRAKDGDIQELDPGETVPTLPSDDNEEDPSTHDVTEVDSMCLFSLNNFIPRQCGVLHTELFH
ncbi:Hypothetical predicted protein [Olea europaea subsp. europaea]|uniref:Uncharacterized protein n=1 Tax=Olea europaea subsp. europaea TaxID=158383 RepID=A0A8S0UF34_OLEEU|nr:Hypothetical predicted protein [Olea europaea subsp. europaea]